MRQSNALLGLIAQTSIHAGAGMAVGVIDLPIQREGHNGWPCVFGSAVKGALRNKAEDLKDEGKYSEELLHIVFGPENARASEHAGALAVGDARLLLLPVRSLTSAFKWVTCPAALKRLKRDAERLGITQLAAFGVPDMQDTVQGCMAYIPTRENAAGEQSISGPGTTETRPESVALFLEEYRFQADEYALLDLITALATLVERDDAMQVLQKQLVIISDDMFSYLVQHATPVNAHIAIESNSKTVLNGALWYEETLPPETVLYLSLTASKSRKEGTAKTEDDVLTAATDTLFNGHPWLQLGGNETVGMGWCAVKVLKAPVATTVEG